ncbi:hypothetical protein HZS_5202 [Henneguya salminicola]|nr:hypothetical protein HZS_5202 [Henneguya salminicola]
MYGEKAVEIIKELLRENEGEISKYNEEGVNAITQEINTLFSNNMQEFIIERRGCFIFSWNSIATFLH